MKKHYLLLILALIVSVNAGIAQDKSITISSPIDDTDSRIVNGKIEARDYIKLSGTFNYNAATDAPLTIKPNPDIICTVDYETTQIDPETREINTALTVGSIPGSYDVTPTGALSYSIPLDIPAGTAGMQPNLSLVYNSQAGNGLLGYGWNLSGLSAISRLGTNIFNDGIIDGIDFDGNDRFALDGQRLLNTTGGYMQDGTIYHTENDPFTEIVQNGSYTEDFNFEVKTKDGKTLYYGSNSNSKIVTDVWSRTNNKFETASWFLDQVKDNQGNSYKINYHADHTNGEYYPEEINYTINDNTGLSAFNKIKFYYEERTIDRNVLYVDYKGIKQEKLLYKIDILQNGILYRRYILKYLNNASLYSQLMEVIEYGANGEKLNSSFFNWKNDIPKQNFTAFLNEYEKFRTYPADYNGDGKTDFLMITAPNESSDFNYWILFITQNSGTQLTYLKVDEGYLPSRFEDVLLTDQNKDGITDVFFKRYQKITYQYCYDSEGNPCVPGDDDDLMALMESTETGEVIDYNNPYVQQLATVEPPDDDDCICNTYYYWDMVLENYYFNGSELIRNSSKDIRDAAGYNADTDDTRPTFVADFDGDGDKDVLILDENYNYRVTKGTTISNIPDFKDPSYINITDFNGNGIPEIFIMHYENYQYLTYIWEYDGSTNEYVELRGSNIFYWRPYFGDFNGDGKTDVLNWEGSNHWKIYFSKGNIGILEESTITPPPLSGYNNPDGDDYGVYKTKYQIYIIDVNNDGKDDIVYAPMVYDAEAGYDQDFFTRWIYYYTEEGFIGKNYTINEDVSRYRMESLNIGDFDGNGVKDLFTIKSNTQIQVDNAAFGNPGIIESATTGFSNTLNFDYSTLADPNTYTKLSGSQFPVINIQTPIKVLSEVEYENETGSLETVSFTYQGAKVHVQGKGFLGFSKMTKTNSLNNATVDSYFTFDLSFYNLIPARTVSSINGNAISETIYTNNKYLYFSNKCYFAYASQVENRDYLHGTTIITNNTFDTDGNLELSTTNYGDGNSKSVSTSYIARTGAVLKSLPEIITSSGTFDGDTKETKTKFFYNVKDLPYQKIDFYGSKSKSITSEFTYDDFGNITSTTVSAPEVETRTESFVYDNSGRFIVEKTDALDNITEMTYDELGNLTSITDPNGLTTRYKYDYLGRKIQEILPTGIVINYETEWAKGTGPENALYYTKQSASGAPVSKIYYDKKGKVLQKETEGFGGTKIYADFVYDEKGQLVQQSLPYKSGETKTWNTTDYDDYGRVNHKTGPDTDITISSAFGTNTVTTTDNLLTGSESVKTFNAAGLLTSSTDPGGTINYTYYGSGQQKNIIYPDGTITLQYDDQGNKTQLIDPDAGQMDYVYNGLGELTSQTDARGNIYTMTYDKAGRILTKNCNDGTSTVYTYDTQMKGMLYDVVHNKGIEKHYTYDNFGRVTKSSEIIPDNASNKVEYSYVYSYDSYGRVKDVIYPSGFKIQKLYDSYGYLSQIYNVTKSEPVWTANSMNAFGQIEDYDLGNGIHVNYVYDLNKITNISAGTLFSEAYTYYDYGNIETITYKNLSPVTFTYDNLNRLTSLQREWLPLKSYGYDDNGNITSKTDIGTLNYDNTHGASAHAVSSVTNNQFIKTQLQNITYNSFNSIATISENNKSLHFTYGPDQNRKKVNYYSNSLLEKTTYYSGLYEKEEATGNNRQLNYISSPDGIIAVYIIDNSGLGSMHYIHKDYLGSIRAISDNSGNLEEEYMYDPWGNRCNTDYSLLPQQEYNLIINRGFTGHEYMDAFGLINMNGRVYDPALGRFLHPDNNLQLPDFTQNFNRYTYALNNPLMFTDPDGEFWNYVISAAIGGITNWASNGAEFSWEGLAYFGIGAVTGAVSYGAGSYAASAVSGPASGFASTAAFGAAGGFVGGFVSGTGNAWVSGAGFDQGITVGLQSAGLSGSLGALISGVSYGLRYLYYNAKVELAVARFPSNPDGTLIPNNETLKKFSDEVFSDFIYENKANNIYDNDYIMARAKADGKDYGAFADVKNINKDGTYNIRYSTSSFNSKKQLYFDMGHEYVHIANKIELGSKFHSQLSEYAAYYWNYKLTGKTVYFNMANNPDNGGINLMSLDGKAYLKTYIKPNYMKYDQWKLWYVYP